MIQKQIKSIGILGGGISGLSQAYYLNKHFPDAQIKIYEKSDQLGGAMQTKQIEKQIYDLGPRSLRNSSNLIKILKILEESNSLDQILPSQHFDKVFLYYDQKMRSVPRSVNFTTIKDFIIDNPKLITSAFKGITFQSNKKPQKQDKTIEEFIRQTIRLGPLYSQGLQDFLVHYFANAVFAGIYRASPEELSYQICLKKQHIKNYYNKNLPQEQQETLSKDLIDFKDSFKASSFSFKQGIQQLPFIIQSLLEKSNNFQSTLNSNIINLIFDKQDQKTKIELQDLITGNQQTDTHDIVISTLKAHQISDILNQDNKNYEIVNILNSIKHLSMKTLNLGFDQEIVPNQYKSFGALIPKNQNFEGLGLILNSTIFPSYSPQGKSNISLFLSEHASQQQIENNLEIIVQKCLQEMLQTQNVQPSHMELKNWDNFFPVYEMHGNYIFTGAIPDLIQQSEVISNIIYQKHISK